MGRLIIFQALAVNAGSLLTPIGNPQNILLWSRSGLSFLGFIGQMAPFGAAMMLSLLALTWFSFPARDIVKTPNTEGYLSTAAVAELRGAVCGLPAVLGYRSAAVWVAGGVRRLLLLARRVLLQIDWSLIFVFAAMFIDVGLFTRLPPLQPAFAAIAGLSDGGVYALGVGLSQIVSNVPATILLLNYVPASAQLAYAVNAGGFGWRSARSPT